MTFYRLRDRENKLDIINDLHLQQSLSKEAPANRHHNLPLVSHDTSPSSGTENSSLRMTSASSRKFSNLRYCSWRGVLSH